ncbi:hypothetical protein HRbin31_00160 [bacterium HR31]|nr:hypothetical protein HRbin31_00160 [bacterium HR31]
MTVPFNRPCPQCGGEMELLASDELGAVVVYECAECGYQAKERVEEVLEPAEEDEVALQPEEEEEEEFPEEEEDEEFEDSLWEDEEEEEDAWR